MKWTRYLIPVLFTLLTALQCVCLIEGIAEINLLGITGYINAVVGFGAITGISWWLCINMSQMEKDNLLPTKETMKYRRRKNDKEN